MRREKYLVYIVSMPFALDLHASLVNRKVIGAIDGSHIKIPAPDEANLASYYNYKKVILSCSRGVIGIQGSEGRSLILSSRL